MVAYLQEQSVLLAPAFGHIDFITFPPKIVNDAERIVASTNKTNNVPQNHYVAISREKVQ